MREKCRALFKKGQKCLIPKFFEQGSDEMLMFVPGEIMRAEKRTVEGATGPVASYHYRVQYVDEGKEYDEWKEECDLYKYHVDLLSGEESLLAEQVRQQAWQQHDLKKAQARLEKIPERLRLRIPVVLKKCVVEEHTRVCLGGEVEAVRPRVRPDSLDEDLDAADPADVKMGEDPAERNAAGGDNGDSGGHDERGGFEAMETDDVGKEGDDGRRGDGEDGRHVGQATTSGAGRTDDKEPTGDVTMKDNTGGGSGEGKGKKRELSVAGIIKMWRMKMLQEDEVIQDDTLEEGINIIAESLLTYFNLSVRQFLLYAPEVPLYDAMFGGAKKRKWQGGEQGGQGTEDLEPVDVYGAEHLVRLLVKLPELVCVQMMVLPVESARYIVAVEDRLMELMEFLADEFFSDVHDGGKHDETGDATQNGGGRGSALNGTEDGSSPKDSA